MAILVTFLLNAGLAFALSLVVASLLGPDAFGRYAIGLSIATVVNTVLFEWLRLSTTRFQSERAERETPQIRRTIDIAYLVSGIVVVVLTAVAMLFDPGWGLSRPMMGAAAGCGLAYGYCEYRMALARALFRQKSWVALSFSRALFGFFLAVGAAWLTGDPVHALAGMAVAAILPVLLVQHTLKATGGPGAVFDRRLLATFARYAVPLIAANALYQIMPLLNRGLLAGRDGFVEAGYFSLVSELATRLFQNLGTALDILLFQLAVRAEETHGREAAERQIALNASIVAAIVLPSAAGLLVVWPSFEALFVPEAFRGHLDGSVPFLVPALAIYALLQFGVNPFFQVRHRTAPVVAAALAALAVNLAAILLWPRLPGAFGFSLAQFAGLAAGLLVLTVLAVSGGARLPWRDLAVAASGSAVMAGALVPLRDLGAPLPTLALQVALGCAIYGVIALATDLCGCRDLVRSALGRPMRGERLR